MKRFSRRDIVRITKALVGGIIDSVPLQQQIVEELSSILGIERCLIYKISDHRDGNDYEVEIVAGVPIGEHGIGIKESVAKHPDIEEVIRFGKEMIITNPQTSPLTAHFRRIIERNDVTQILYLPLDFEPGGRIISVIVLDAVSGKIFDPEEIKFCGEIGEIISFTIGREKILIAKTQDLIRNCTVPLGGFLDRLRKTMNEIPRYTQIIDEEIRRLEEISKKDGIDF